MRDAYALNNPLSFKDPSGLDCQATEGGWECDPGDVPPGYSYSGQNGDGNPIYTDANGNVYVGDALPPLNPGGSYLPQPGFGGPGWLLSGSNSTAIMSSCSAPYNCGASSAGGSGVPHTGVAGSVSIPVSPGVLISIPFALLPNGDDCIGLGVGFGSPGVGVNAGIVHSSSNLEDVMSGPSISGSIQAGWVGGQFSTNTSGTAYGNSMGSPGASLTVSYSKCG